MSAPAASTVEKATGDLLFPCKQLHGAHPNNMQT